MWKYEKRFNKKELDYQDKLWNKPEDLKYKDAEFNIGISEFKEMLREYKVNKEKATQNASEEYFGLIEENQGLKSFKEDKELKRLFLRKKFNGKVKVKFGVEGGYTLEQATSGSELEEFEEDAELDELNESDFVLEEETLQSENSKLNSPISKRSMSNDSRGMSPKNKVKFAKKMDLMKNALKLTNKGEENNKSKEYSNIIQEENNESTARELKLNTVSSKDNIRILDGIMSKIRITNLDPSIERDSLDQTVREFTDENEEKSKLFLTQTKNIRRYLVKEESRPNISLPLNKRGKEDEQDIIEQGKEQETESSSKPGLEKIVSEGTNFDVGEEKFLKRGISDLDLLNVLADDKETVCKLISGKFYLLFPH